MTGGPTAAGYNSHRRWKNRETSVRGASEAVVDAGDGRFRHAHQPPCLAYRRALAADETSTPPTWMFITQRLPYNEHACKRVLLNIVAEGRGIRNRSVWIINSE